MSPATHSSVDMSMAKPFLRWAGGKGQLLDELDKYVPKKFGRYFEPFLGAGALFYHLESTGRIQSAILSDLNARLVNTFRCVRDEVGVVIAVLEELAEKHSKKRYYVERARLDEQASYVRAARFIYINKTCFNGLYRVNKKDGFNVPLDSSKKKENILDEARLRVASAGLCGHAIMNADFVIALRDHDVRRGDFCYFDPPYVPVGADSDFTTYTKEPFGPSEQIRLMRVAKWLREKGVHVVLSNSDTRFVRELYKDFDLHPVQARRNINSKTGKRGAVGELIIT
jgi:DNA adenine methylase